MSVYRQAWCGQSQPHNSHVWADNPSGLYATCAGHSGAASEVAPGPCWHDSGQPWIGGNPGAGNIRCELLAGHAGAHVAKRTAGGESVWPNDPSVSSPASGGEQDG